MSVPILYKVCRMKEKAEEYKFAITFTRDDKGGYFAECVLDMARWDYLIALAMAINEGIKFKIGEETKKTDVNPYELIRDK